MSRSVPTARSRPWDRAIASPARRPCSCSLYSPATGRLGLQLTDASGLDSGSSVAIQSDGKIVAVGGSAEDFLVARYDSGGNPDPSFHDDGVYTNLGVRTTDFGGSDGAGGVRAPARRQDRGRRDQLHVRCRRLRYRPLRPGPLQGGSVAGDGTGQLDAPRDRRDRRPRVRR